MTVVFAVAMAAMLSAVAANAGMERRAERVAWRTPVELRAGETPVARLSTVVSSAAGRSLTETTYAPLVDDAPVPPGFETPVRPGRFAVSPALASLARSNPDLARFRGASATIGDDGLLHADELAVVRFATPDDPHFAVPNAGVFLEASPATEVSRLADSSADTTLSGTYRLLVALGTVVLIVPAFTMTAAAARLIGSRRARELATARLIGARRNQLATIAALDVARPATWGVVVGTVATLALLPLATLVPVQGGPFGFADLLPPVAWWLGCAAAVMLTAVVTAAVAVRRSAADPLGIASGRRRCTAGLWRLAFAVVAGAVFLGNIGGEGLSTITVMLLWGGVVLAIDAVGPLLMRVVAAIRVRLARRAGSVVAARRMADDPVAAYRQIGALVLVAFVSGMLLSITSTLNPSDSDGRLLRVASTPQAEQRLATALRGLPEVREVSSVELGLREVLLVDLDRPASADRVRAKVAETAPGAVAVTPEEEMRSENEAIADFRRASVMLFLAVAVSAAVAVAAGAVGSIIDQQRGLTALRTLGVPVHAIHGARRRTIVVPLILATSLAAVAGSLLAASSMQASPPSSAVALLSAVVILAVACALVAQESTRPFLDRMTADRRVLQA